MQTTDSDVAVKTNRITVVGAGLSGSLTALLLAKRGYEVDLYEGRNDFREDSSYSARSINLALSCRGLSALHRAGVAEEIESHAIPMFGRMMHSPTGKLVFQEYGLEGQAILSVGRELMNTTLLNLAEQQPTVTVHFEHRLQSVDLQSNKCTFTGRGVDGDSVTTEESDLVVGCDGVSSVVRTEMQKLKPFDFSQEYLDHAYKELTIPPTVAGDFAMDHNVLHIWPRKNFMMIALPNPNRSFTVTLFMPQEDLDALDQPHKVLQFFEKHFADSLPLMPTLLEDFFRNPTSLLVTTQCNPFHYSSTAVLVGDAAHAVVPFYGQGMNCALEDVRLLDDLIQVHNGDLAVVLSKYTQLRKPDADAIRQLSLDNYEVMRNKVSSPWFLLKGRIERFLHKVLPQSYLPTYSMVSFSNIRYSHVLQIAEQQDRAINFFLFRAIPGIAVCVGALHMATRLGYIPCLARLPGLNCSVWRKFCQR